MTINSSAVITTTADVARASDEALKDFIQLHASQPQHSLSIKSSKAPAVAPSAAKLKRSAFGAENDPVMLLQNLIATDELNTLITQIKDNTLGRRRDYSQIQPIVAFLRVRNFLQVDAWRAVPDLIVAFKEFQRKELEAKAIKILRRDELAAQEQQQKDERAVLSALRRMEDHVRKQEFIVINTQPGCFVKDTEDLIKNINIKLAAIYKAQKRIVKAQNAIHARPKIANNLFAGAKLRNKEEAAMHAAKYTKDSKDALKGQLGSMLAKQSNKTAATKNTIVIITEKKNTINRILAEIDYLKNSKTPEDIKIKIDALQRLYLQLEEYATAIERLEQQLNALEEMEREKQKEMSRKKESAAARVNAASLLSGAKGLNSAKNRALTAGPLAAKKGLVLDDERREAIESLYLKDAVFRYKCSQIVEQINKGLQEQQKISFVAALNSPEQARLFLEPFKDRNTQFANIDDDVRKAMNKSYFSDAYFKAAALKLLEDYNEKNPNDPYDFPRALRAVPAQNPNDKAKPSQITIELFILYSARELELAASKSQLRNQTVIIRMRKEYAEDAEFRKLVNKSLHISEAFTPGIVNASFEAALKDQDKFMQIQGIYADYREALDKKEAAAMKEKERAEDKARRESEAKAAAQQAKDDAEFLHAHHIDFVPSNADDLTQAENLRLQEAIADLEKKLKHEIPDIMAGFSETINNKARQLEQWQEQVAKEQTTPSAFNIPARARTADARPTPSFSSISTDAATTSGNSTTASDDDRDFADAFGPSDEDDNLTFDDALGPDIDTVTELVSTLGPKQKTFMPTKSKAAPQTSSRQAIYLLLLSLLATVAALAAQTKRYDLQENIIKSLNETANADPTFRGLVERSEFASSIVYVPAETTTMAPAVFYSANLTATSSESAPIFSAPEFTISEEPQPLVFSQARKAESPKVEQPELEPELELELELELEPEPEPELEPELEPEPEPEPEPPKKDKSFRNGRLFSRGIPKF